MSERWAAVVGYEGLYEVSDLGRVRSLPHRVPCKHGSRVSPGRLLKLSYPGVKYQCITLFKNGVSRSHTVHVMVLRAFVGEPGPGLITCHWNGNGHDNRLENLRWDTREANAVDAKRLGELLTGEDHPTSKLKSEEIISIRERVAAGDRTDAIAADYGIHRMTVNAIARRDIWKCIP